MTYLGFAVGFILYILTVIISYSESFKKNPYYYTAGLLIALGTNTIWLYLAKTSSGNSLYIRALTWDSMIVGTYAIIPILFYNIKLSPVAAVGCIMVVIGLVLTKVS